VQSKQQEIVKLQQELSTHDDKVHALSEHSRNVNQELTHTLGLCKAREHQVETEDHLKQIAQREEGRLKQEIKRVENDLTDIKERKNIYENTIFKDTKQLEELKSQMNWDQQALEAWLEESARKDEDSMTLAKYTRMDEAKVK
ncbi:coiled-coil domain-containing protein 39-like, partial [Anneissia japonica]|uniref:coiled-coil domain-containing protein 39-like n=1 Tax=Anneissia japonica TaxID=1529436 RepID=UPI00142556F8